MGKKSKKRDAAESIKASKKDAKKRAALKAREAELAAELERRKAAKKSKGKKPKPESITPSDVSRDERRKKAKKTKRDERETPVEDMGITASAEAPIVPEHVEPEVVEAVAVEPEPAEAVAERIKPLKGKVLKAAMQADTEAGKKRKAEAEAQAETDAEIRARVQAKRDARLAEMQHETETTGQIAKARKRAKTIEPAEGDHVLGTREKSTREKIASAAKRIPPAPLVPEHVAEVVETETGREFAVGTPTEEEFAKPSEATPELESGRNGYKIIQLGTDGKPDPRKVRQMTRVTTFVGNIDDETMIRDWEKRLLAVGLSAAADEYAPRVNDLTHRRDVKLAKARKADRKGKLDIGELARIETDAAKEWKDALNAIVEEALDVAGRHEKADAGTNLHALAELADEHGIDHVRAMYERDDTISATDLASTEAYAARMARLNAKVIESEAVIVNDEMGYAGRLDRVIMAKLPALTIAAGTPFEWKRPADQRARRYVTDIKSGRIDLGAGKIARQLAAYALGDLYDLETGARSRHSAARDIALVFHLPQGAGVCTVHAVDIKAGAVLLRLSADVRRARNSGKKTIDTSVDIADPEPGE